MYQIDCVKMPFAKKGGHAETWYILRLLYRGRHQGACSSGNGLMPIEFQSNRISQKQVHYPQPYISLKTKTLHCVNSTFLGYGHAEVGTLRPPLYSCLHLSPYFTPLSTESTFNVINFAKMQSPTWACSDQVLMAVTVNRQVKICILD